MCGGMGGGGGYGVSANEYSCAHGAQINFGDLTPYLTYASFPLHIANHIDYMTTSDILADVSKTEH